MSSSNLGSERPVLEEEPSRLPRWQAAGAVALAVVLLVVVLLVLGRDGPVEETTTAGPLATTAVTMTSEAATTTSAATTTTLAASGLYALAAFQAGPLPPEATCPPGSAPDTPGDPNAPRPPLDSLDPFEADASAAFDRESGLLVLLVEDPSVYPEHCLAT
jgi:hypothetical protein